VAYYLDLSSPETHERFGESDKSVSGFRPRNRNAASKIKPGDYLVCYLTRLSRWVGLLRVESTYFEDSRPIFGDPDPFPIRFKVKPEVWLAPEQGIPIRDDSIWKKLSLTRSHPKTTPRWTGFFRTSLNEFTEEDGEFLASILRGQSKKPFAYPLSDDDRRALTPHVVRREGGVVVVTVPTEERPEEVSKAPRESIQIQALLAQIGSKMGLKIWIPANDCAAVLKECKSEKPALVESLPLNYDKATIDTIERIDVLWLKGRSIVRAFEVEHTTAIYSGILRMADLLSLQPNMDIKLHIVAPEERKQKVFDEISRPVFSLLERRPLSKICTFLSYDSVREVASLDHLAHVSDTILDEYEEEAASVA
jgi:hypothetical protein